MHIFTGKETNDSPSANYCRVHDPPHFPLLYFWPALHFLYSFNNLLSALLQELGGEACLGHAESSFKAEVPAALAVTGQQHVLLGQDGTGEQEW